MFPIADALFLLAMIVQAPMGSPLAPSSSLMHLRVLASDVAKLGEKDLLSRLRLVLIQLGDDPKAVDKLSMGWEKSLTAAKEGKNDRNSATKKLEQAVAELGKSLSGLDG